MEFASGYQTLGKRLSRELFFIHVLTLKRSLSRDEEQRLRHLIKTVVETAQSKLERSHDEHFKSGYPDITSASEHFEQIFGHAPGDVEEIREGRFSPINNCGNTAEGIARVLSTGIAKERIGIVRLNGPEQIHPSILVHAANGKTYVADPWSSFKRKGVQTLEEFKKDLLESIQNKRRRLNDLSNQLGLNRFRNIQEVIEHPLTFQESNLGLLHASAHENLANLYLDYGHDQEALHHANQALGFAPDSDNAHLIRANVHFSRRHYRRALQAYRKALAAYPYNIPAMEGSKACHQAFNQMDEYEKINRLIESHVHYDPKSRDAFQRLEEWFDEQDPPKRWEPHVQVHIRFTKD